MMDTPRHFIDAIENTWTSEHLTGPDALRDEVEVVEAKLEQEAAAAETMVAGGIEESRQLAEHLGAMNRAVETRLTDVAVAERAVQAYSTVTGGRD